MSLAIIKDVIGKFLRSDRPEVLALKGAWGSGKTHAWHNIVREMANEIALPSYSYVSLFGISSISQLKVQIYIKMASVVQNAQTNSLARKWFGKKKSDGKNTYFKFSQVFKDIPYLKNFASAFEIIAPSLIQDCIVCLDDFERITKAITPEELLGFIVELREEHNCKVVLIFNDAAVKGDSKYNEYREKVIDREVLFAPTAIEAASLVIDDSFERAEELRGLCVKLGITNIRVLRKIADLATILRSALVSYHSEVLTQALHSLVLLAWCYYEPNVDKPSLDFILSMTGTGWSKYIRENEKNPKHDEWMMLLKEYGFLHLNDLDVSVFETIKNGYVEGSAIDPAAKQIDKQQRSSEQRELLDHCWKLYRNNFDDNQTELVVALFDATSRSLESIGVGDLSGVTSLLRELGEVQTADDLIDAYINFHAQSGNLVDLSTYPFAHYIDDTVLRDKINNWHEEKKVALTFSKVMERLVDEPQGYTDTSVDVLKRTTADEFYTMFKSRFAVEPEEAIKQILKLGGFPGNETIRERAVAALRRIGQESALNAIRVRRFNLD